MTDLDTPSFEEEKLGEYSSIARLLGIERFAAFTCWKAAKHPDLTHRAALCLLIDEGLHES